MNRLLAILLPLLFFAGEMKSQVQDPVSWDFRFEKKDSGRYEIVITASIEEGSHIYSMDVPENGPIPTTVSFDSTGSFVLLGKPYEVTIPEEKFDEAFGFKIKIFEGKAEFRQKLISEAPFFTVKGVINYMSCTSATCLPPKDVEFSLTIGEVPGDEKAPATAVGTSGLKGLLKFFIASFLLGLIGVLTPCVYPMIPMTVAFFTRSAEKRSKTIMNALIFGVSIVLIYTSPGIIISLTGAGAGFTSALSTHWIPNLIFFLLFLLFATSFFGAFEVVLPNRWVSSADSKVDRGGILASFFLALTTVIVSFSCTGPIVGSLLVEAASGDILRPAVGMFAFGLAFAVPFTIFALFPAVLGRLPKSGGWLNSIKVVLGFLMLAFSLKFLVTIDAVYGLKIISRELFIAIWIVISILTGLYLMGKLKFEYDSELKHIGVFRLFLIIAVFSFAVYLVPGLFGAEMRGLESLLPAKKTSSLIRAGNDTAGACETASPATLPVISGSDCSKPKYAGKFEMPYGLKGYFDYNQGLACAGEQGKPVLLDFKGHACANCKLMEAKVWSDPRVQERLRKFVIIALYTDDRTQLPENERIVSKVDGKVKKTIGKVNEDIEIMMFNTNAIPLYAITDSRGNILNKPMATNMNVEDYIKWLDEGLALFVR